MSSLFKQWLPQPRILLFRFLLTSFKWKSSNKENGIWSKGLTLPFWLRQHLGFGCFYGEINIPSRDWCISGSVLLALGRDQGSGQVHSASSLPEKPKINKISWFPEVLGTLISPWSFWGRSLFKTSKLRWGKLRDVCRRLIWGTLK